MAESERELPRYQSHKQVWALKIAKVAMVDNPALSSPVMVITPADEGYAPFEVTQEFITHRFRPVGGDLGYYVRYEDGFASWSPSKAFEDGYTRI